jgi:hypothetical protein
VKFWRRLIGGEEMEGVHEPSRRAQEWLELVDSGNGFERQEAVDMLGRLRHAPALPALLARVNDWVPQVRESAVVAVRALMDEAFIDAWAGSIEAIVALDRARRVDHAHFLGEIADFLAGPACLPHLLRGLDHGSSAARRYVSGLEWQVARTEDQRVGQLGSLLGGGDIMLARVAMSRMSTLPAEAQQALAGIACHSRFGPVRAAGLRVLLASADRAAPTLALEFCLDTNSLVRTVAWNAVQRFGEAEAAIAAGLALFERPDGAVRQRSVALRFLCMADPEAFLQLCMRGAHDAAVAVRLVAIDALLNRLRGSEQEEWLLAALADPSPRIQRLAVGAVQRGALPPDPALVVETALAHGDGRSLARALGVLRRYSPWLRLHWLLSTLGRGLPADGMQACLDAVATWDRDATSCFSKPSEEESHRLREDWRRHGAGLPEALRSRVAWQLRANHKILKEEGNDDRIEWR